MLIRRDVIVLLSVVHANVVINTPVSSYSTGKKKRICKKNVRRMCPQYPSRATHLAPLPETPLEASASFAGLPVALAPSSVATPPFPPPPSTTTRVASESPAPSLFKAGDSARVGGGSAAATEGAGAAGAVGAANAAGGGAATPPYAPPTPTGAAGAGAYGWYPDIAADLLK